MGTEVSSKYQDTKIGFLTSKELDPVGHELEQGIAAVLRRHDFNKEAGILNTVFNKVMDFNPARLVPSGKFLAGAAFVSASVMAATSPQELGKFAGDVGAGFQAATMHQQLCKEDCAIPRIAGEKIGGWAVQFEKGYNSRFTQ